MDKIEKFLKRLNKKELSLVIEALSLIKSGETENLDIKKLTGQQDIYRVRMATIRIIFLTTRDKIEILEISRRSEKTYKNF